MENFAADSMVVARLSVSHEVDLKMAKHVFARQTREIAILVFAHTTLEIRCFESTIASGIQN